MGLQDSLTTGDRVRQVDRTPMAIEPGTLLHKAIPPRMVEPYLTGRRSIITGFVHRVADSSFTCIPRPFPGAMSLDYEGSEFSPDMEELYLLRWRAVSTESYQVPYSVALGGDWAMKPPFTGTGYTAEPGPPGARVLHRPDAGSGRGGDLPDHRRAGRVRRPLRRPGVASSGRGDSDRCVTG